jgi:hypothetical protein
MLIIQSQFTGSELTCVIHLVSFIKQDWLNLNLSFKCGKTVARIRVNGNISPFLPFAWLVFASVGEHHDFDMAYKETSAYLPLLRWKGARFVFKWGQVSTISSDFWSDSGNTELYKDVQIMVSLQKIASDE